MADQRSVDRRERRFEFVAHAVEQRLLQFLRIAHDTSLTLCTQRTLLAESDSQLRGARFEQFALCERRRRGQPDGEHAFRAVAGEERKVQRFRLGQRVREAACGLAILE